MAKKNFEPIKPWDGTSGTGQDIRLIIKNNFDKVNEAIEELTADTAAGFAIIAAETAIEASETANAAAENAPKVIDLISLTNGLPDPLTLNAGDKAYDTTSKKVYTVTAVPQDDNTWNVGVAPRKQDVHVYENVNYKWIDNELISPDKLALLSSELADTKAGIANEAAILANTKAGLADEKATAANEAATLANTKAGLADEKATAANNAATLANTKAGLAQTAATNADAAKDAANTAASAVNSAVLSAGYISAIAYNAAAPTPGISGYYEFSSAGSCSWITGGAVTVKVGDRVSVKYTAPSTYVYTHINVDLTNVDLTVNKISLKTTWTDNYFIAGNGTSGSYSGQSITDYISVLPGRKITVKTIGIAGTNMAFYDANKVFISATSSPTTFVETELTIPSNAYFLRYTCTTSNKNVSSALISVSEISAYMSTLENLLSQRLSLVLCQNGDNILPSSITYTDNYFLNSGGIASAHTDYSITDFIECSGSKTYQINKESQYGYIAFYDANKVYISTIGDIATNNYNFTAPASAKFFKTTIKKANKGTVTIIFTGTTFAKESPETIADIVTSLIPINSSITAINSKLAKLIVSTNDNIIPSGITFTNGYYLSGAGGENMYGSSPGNTYSISDYILCNASQNYRLNKKADYAYIAFYDANKVFISTVGQLSSDNYNFTTPAGCCYMRVSVLIENQNIFTVINTGATYMPIPNGVYTAITNALIPINTSITTINSKLSQLIIATNDNILPSGITFKNGYYLSGAGGENMYGSSPGNTYSITDYFDCKGGQTYRLNKKADYAYIAFYNSDKVFLSAVGQLSSDNYDFTTHAEAKYMRVTVLIANQSTVTVINTGATYIKSATSSGSSTSISSINPILFGKSKIGCLDYQPIIPNGYNHIIFNGQSLSTGDVTYTPISTLALSDCYMIGTTPRSVSGAFNGLVGAVSGNSGEPPVVGAVNALKKRINKTLLKDAKFIGTAVGQGGQSIEVLSKACTNTTNQLTSENLYYTRFLVALNTAKANAGATPIVCPAIVWMQGEANQAPDNYLSGMTYGSEQTHTKAAYKAYLKQLKNDMQADIMSVYGQSYKPLFFVYQTSAEYMFSNFQIPITQAQYELAMEEDDVILLNPHYHVPNAYNGGGHLNANGSRWYGELCAKSIYDAVVEDNCFNPVIPKKFVIDGSDIYIHCHVPVPPLVIDIKTLQSQTNYGFTVKKDSVVQAIVSVEIIGGTCIKLHLGASVATGTIDVSYAGTTQNGRGNIRDSDANLSFANYVDDTSISNNVPPYTPVDSSNVNYYGRKYPLWNWLSNFYLNIQQ